MHDNDEIAIGHTLLSNIDKSLYPYKKLSTLVAMMIAFAILTAWLSSNLASMLPAGWFYMQITTALPILLLSFSLWLRLSDQTQKTLKLQRLLIIIAGMVSCFALYEHLQGEQTAILAQLLIDGSHDDKAHPSSMQSSLSLLIIASLLYMDEQVQGARGNLYCTLLFILTLLAMTFIASYILGSKQLIAQTDFILISIQSVICIGLLTLTIILLRAPYSHVFSIFFRASLGGEFARRFLSITVLVILGVMLLEVLLMWTGKFTANDINAIVITVDIALLFFIIIVASRKIEHQSHLLEELVITDKLTAVLNLRGLNIYAEQKLLDAKRNQAPLTVLLFDLDGLKTVNDELGHDIGSDLIKEFALTLKNNFRSNDIVARVGGDEFVVIAMEASKEITFILNRLSDIICGINNTDKNPYQISFSVGSAQLQNYKTQTIEDLMKIADEKMYAAKRKKKALLSAQQSDTETSDLAHTT